MVGKVLNKVFEVAFTAALAVTIVSLAILACQWVTGAAARGDLVSTPQVPRALSAPAWEQGTDGQGRSGWFIVRKDSSGRSWIYASDQPSGKQEPCYLHRRGSVSYPLEAPSALGYSVGGATNYGLNMAELGHGPAGGQVLTNDPAFGGKLMAELGEDGKPCPGPVCPPKEPDDDEPDPGADSLRQYLVPGACALAVLGFLIFIRRRAS